MGAGLQAGNARHPPVTRGLAAFLPAPGPHRNDETAALIVVWQQSVSHLHAQMQGKGGIAVVLSQQLISHPAILFSPGAA